MRIWKKTYPLKSWISVIKESCAEGILQIIIVKMSCVFSKAVVTEAAFRNKNVDMRVPY